ncbi:hypothetical protein C0991_012397, partial [Blastosporella zonata]
MVTINALALQVQNPSFSLLASLQRLTTLAISVSSDDLLQFSKTAVGQYSLFQLVETLDLYVPDMNAAVHLFNLPRSFESLTSLTLRNSDCFQRDMLPLFRAMQKNSALCEHLKKLEVLANDEETPAPIISPANFSTFEPLSSLCNLRVLIVDITGLAEINDAGLEWVGATLPRLETFVLAESTKRGFGEMPTMTLGGIVPFLTSCPQLQRL